MDGSRACCNFGLGVGSVLLQRGGLFLVLEMLSVDLFGSFCFLVQATSCDVCIHDDFESICLDVHSCPLWAKANVAGFDSIYAFDSHAVLSILRISGIYVRVQ